MKGPLCVAGLIGLASAHTGIYSFHINGVPNADCVRLPVTTNPIIDLGSDSMACNIVQGNAKSKCVVKGGDQIAFEWRVDPFIPAKDYPLKNGAIPVGVTDDSHKGPCAIYLKKVDDALTATGPGPGWCKVSHDSVDPAGVFCSDRLRLANAPQPGVIPKNIAAGDYLIRGELLSLNNAGPANIGGQEEPQFYAGCVQITVEGTSGDPNAEKVSIPGYVTKSTPGLIFDIWNSPSNSFTDYPPMFGPAPISPAPATSPPPPGASQPPPPPPEDGQPPPPPPEANLPPPPEDIEPQDPTTTAAPSSPDRGRGRGGGRGRGRRPWPTR